MNLSNYLNHIKKYIIILDIDETLTHSLSDGTLVGNLNIYSDPKKMDIRDRIYTINVPIDRNNGISTLIWGIKRPHLDIFLNFCFLYFKIVIVWSAGTYEYVHSIVPELFKNTYEPHYILTRDNCVEYTDTHGKRYEKPFWKLLQDFPELEKYVDIDVGENERIKSRGGIDTGRAGFRSGKSGGIYKNIIIIDDKPHSFDSDPENGILIPIYEPLPSYWTIKADDDALLKIMNFFHSLPKDVSEVRGTKDVNDTSDTGDLRKIDKRKIFEK